MSFVRFAKSMVIVLLSIWAVGGYPLYLWRGGDEVLAAAVGCGICVFNALLGAGVAMWAMEKSQTTFFAAVFGGMGLRLFVVLTFFLVALKLVKLHVFGLTLSLFLFYILFLILEIKFFARQSSGDAPPNEGF